MTKWKLVNCFLVLAIIFLMSRLPAANSQLTGVHIVASTAVVKPSIDGLWQTGEWDDANEYQYSYAYFQVNLSAEAYVRCKHDNASLYWLIDVPSDNGSVYVKGEQKWTGTAAFSFDTDMDGISQIDPADLGFVTTTSGNGTSLNFLYNKPTWSSQINAAQQLGVSPHSSKLHRVYEISMPFESLLQYNARVDNLPAIYVDLTVTDSYGNGLDLSWPPHISVLEFGAIPIPENIEPLIPLVLAILTLISCLHRKNVHIRTAKRTSEKFLKKMGKKPSRN
jgi:hypothetical protein